MKVSPLMDRNETAGMIKSQVTDIGSCPGICGSRCIVAWRLHFVSYNLIVSFLRKLAERCLAGDIFMALTFHS